MIACLCVVLSPSDQAAIFLIWVTTNIPASITNTSYTSLYNIYFFLLNNKYKWTFVEYLLFVGPE